MKTPLVPQAQFDAIGRLNLSQTPEAEWNPKIKKIIEQMPEINQRTLKFICEYFQEVVDYEPSGLNEVDLSLGEQKAGNKMTSYNIAVTVGPNIFREKVESADSILYHGDYYEVFIRMIDYC